jgi:hypothetical protein
MIASPTSPRIDDRGAPTASPLSESKSSRGGGSLPSSSPRLTSSASTPFVPYDTLGGTGPFHPYASPSASPPRRLPGMALGDGLPSSSSFPSSRGLRSEAPDGLRAYPGVSVSSTQSDPSSTFPHIPSSASSATGLPSAVGSRSAPDTPVLGGEQMSWRPLPQRPTPRESSSSVRFGKDLGRTEIVGGADEEMMPMSPPVA